MQGALHIDLYGPIMHSRVVRHHSSTGLVSSMSRCDVIYEIFFLMHVHTFSLAANFFTANSTGCCECQQCYVCIVCGFAL